MEKTKNKAMILSLRELIYQCGPLPCPILLRPCGRTPSMWLMRDEGDVCERRYIGGYALWKIPFSLYLKFLDFTDGDRSLSSALLENISVILPQISRHAKNDTILSISVKGGAYIVGDNGGKSSIQRLEITAVCLLPYGGYERDVTYHLRLKTGEELLKVGTGFTKFDSHISGKVHSVRYIDEAEYTSYEASGSEETVLECDRLAGDIYTFISEAPVSSELDVVHFTSDGTPCTRRYFMIRNSEDYGGQLPLISCTLSPVI